jgi:hypothetical protein
MTGGEFMQAKRLRIVCLSAVMAIALPALAQFGHPLKGSWSGEWREGASREHRLLLEFNWEGKYGAPGGGTLSGTLNPGTDSAAMTNLKLTPPGGGVPNADAPWILHFEATVKDESGQNVRIVVDGFLENIGAYKRFIHGTFQHGTKKGPFRVVANFGL